MSAAISAIAIAAIGTGYSIYAGERANSQQQRAQRKAKQQALRQESQAQQATNRANRKKPDARSLMAGNAAYAGLGGGSTLLTGAGGVDPGSMNLGRNMLLGG